MLLPWFIRHFVNMGGIEIVCFLIVYCVNLDLKSKALESNITLL